MLDIKKRMENVNIGFVYCTHAAEGKALCMYLVNKLSKTQKTGESQDDRHTTEVVVRYLVWSTLLNGQMLSQVI